jgi:K+-sensing histidine kinase KdpD
LWLGDACVASAGEPLDEGTTAALTEGDGVEGRIVLDAVLDEDRSRLLAQFAYQVSVALQKSLLYAKQLEAAEIANALLEASRELATAETPEEVLRRSCEVTTRVLQSTRAALWIQDGDVLVARASFGYASGEDPVGRHDLDEPVDPAWPDVPFIDPQAPAPLVVAPLRLEGNRLAVLTAAVGERELGERQLRLLAGLAHQARSTSTATS